MIKRKTTLFAALAFVVLCSFECTKKGNAPALPPVQATSYAASIPVLKGVETNPVVRLTLTIPAGSEPVQWKSIACTLNAQGLDAVSKVDVYLTNTNQFNTSSPVVSYTPTKSSFDIPVNLTLQPGTHFLWLSPVLKPDAPVGIPFELRGTSLTNTAGATTNIEQDNSAYVKRTGTAVRRAGDNNVHTYRIPGLATTNKGTLIAVYDIRYDKSGDLPGNIDVGMSRSTDGGRTWEAMKIIMDMGAPHENNGIGDPAVLFDPATKKIWIAALWSKGNRSIAGSLPGLSPDTTGQFVLVSSADDGLTWSAPQSITPQVKNPIWHLFFNGPGNGIAMQDGKLVFAAQYWDEKKMPWSTIIYSADKGTSWQGKVIGPKSNTTESQVVETTPGTLMLNMRDNRGGFRSVATTTNMGTTWTEHATSYKALPDPVCMGSIIKAKVNLHGKLQDVLFFCNPNTSSGRYNITIKASMDMGETWLPANQYLVDERNCYGYSCLTQIDANTLGLLYEGTRDLYFIQIPVEEIIK
jgi:sialidase-1